MAKRETPPVMASVVIERTRQGTREMMICKLPEPPYADKWTFPGGAVDAGESPEAAAHRLLDAMLGMKVNILHAQPPFDHPWSGETRRWRFMFGEAADSASNNRYYREVRWIPRGTLREYEFEPVSQQVVDWLLEERM